MAGAFRQKHVYRPNEEELANFIPDFTVVNTSGNQSRLGTPRYELANLCCLQSDRAHATYWRHLVWRGNEKGLFSVMNYLLPQKGIASMHCSANCGADGDVALFLGFRAPVKRPFPHHQTAA